MTFMSEWATTSEASKEVHLCRHRIAELARQKKIVAHKTGEKKWSVKLRSSNGGYELVKPVELEEIDRGSQIKASKQSDWDRHCSDLAGVACGLSSNFSKLHNFSSFDDAEVSGDVVDGGSIWLHGEPPPFHFSMSDRNDPRRLEKVDSYLAPRLLEHVQQKFPPIFGEIKDWRELNRQDVSEELVEKLSYIAYSRDFDGTTCDICKGWQK